MKSDLKRRLKNVRLGLKAGDGSSASVLGVEGILAGRQGDSLAAWLAEKFNHNFDGYDRAIDAVYNTTRAGGSGFHHLLDGQHSILGAFNAVHHVSADDSWVRELGNATEHIVRDTASSSGINPFFSLTPEQFDTLGSLTAHLGISKVYLADALTLNGSELLGGSVALLSAVMMGRSPQPEKLSRFAGGCLVSAVVSANPILMPIAAASMVYAISKAEDRKAVMIQSGKGALVSGSALLASTLVGGPVWLGCVAGFMTAIAISYALDHPQKALERAQALVQPATQILKDVSSQLLHVEIPQWQPTS